MVGKLGDIVKGNKTETRPCFFPLDGGRCEKIGSVLFHVIPAKAGILCFQGISNLLDLGFHRGDGINLIFSQLREEKGMMNGEGGCFKTS